MLDALLDLCAGSRCAGCGAPGRALCRRCAESLPDAPFVCWPTPTPPGLVRPTAAAEYDGVVRAAVVAHKDHGRLALARPLGRLLADAVEAARPEGAKGAVGRDGAGRVLLVPVPSHGSVVRARGHDPLLRTARVAAARLRGRGLDVRVRPMLQVTRRPQDQAGLDARGRAANVQGRFAVRAGSDTRGDVVIVDDVVTTGSTLREAQRALESAGAVPVVAAVIAATRRRRPPGAGDPG